MLSAALLVSGGVSSSFAGTFTNAWATVSDPTGSLTLNPTDNTLTVSFWFRFSIPSTAQLTENLTLLMDRSDGNESSNYSYLFRYNISNGNVEFLTRGSTTFTKTLITRPFQERWYHVAVVRQGSSFSAYVDGNPVLPLSESTSVGNTSGSGLTIGGTGASSSRAFYGDIIEVAIYQAALDLSLIRDRMFKDQRTSANLKGYYKLGYSTNSADFFKNFAPSAASGTDPLQRQGSGTIEFEETDQAEEQSTFDSRKNSGAESIAPLSGGFGWSQSMFNRPTPGVAFEFLYGYSPGTPTSAPTDGSNDPYDRRVLGPGWRHIFDARLVVQQDVGEFRVITWDGGIETWVKTNNTFKTRHNEYRGELGQLPNGDYEWTTPKRIVWRFRDPAQGILMGGRLVELRDFNGNKVQVQWNETEGIVHQVTDTGGGRFDFVYDTAQGRLTNITFQAWSLSFTYDASLRLASKSITSPASYTNLNSRWQFFYNSNGLLERVMNPRGDTNAFVQYDRFGRRTNEVDELGRATSYAYGVPGKRQITRTDAEGFKWIDTYDRKHRVLSSQDPVGNTTRFAYDATGNYVSVTDALGFKTLFSYDERGNVVLQTNAVGEVRQWVYHSFFNKAIQEITPQPSDVNGNVRWTNYFEIDGTTGNLLRHHDDLGTLVRYTYTANGLVETRSDGDGHVSRMKYDASGFLTSTIDSGGFTNSVGRNEWGWPLAETNALGEVTRYAYDLNGNTVLRLDSLSRLFIREYDANGNLLKDFDAKGRATVFSYDAANQITQKVDRAGFTWKHTYTLRGQPKTAIDPLGNTLTNSYDPANRKVKVELPLGLTAEMQYDAGGRLTNTVDRAAQHWKTVYDRLGRQILEVDPLGNAKRTSYDVAGRIKEIRTPNGFATTHVYDGRGRLKKWVDAEGFDWSYGYDEAGSITNVTDALGGNYVMAYGPRHERTFERNQDGSEWRYEYDALLRPKLQRDPNGTTKIFSYDAAGRLESVTFNTGRVNSFLYDENDNPEVISRSGSGPATIARLTYDELNRVKEYRDPFGKLLRYGFDPAGRLNSTIYPDGKVLTNRFDALGRITNNVFAFSGQKSFEMSFAYDAMDRLLWRKFPNGVIQTNNFDRAGRIAGVQHKSSDTAVDRQIAIAITYAYDRNGNKTGSTEAGRLAWLPLLETEERASYTKAGRLIDRHIQGTGSNQLPLHTLKYKYDGSGNMTNAFGGGHFFALAYDEDNRVTSLNWDSGLTAVAVKNRYDVFGRRVAKNADGVENRYVLDLATEMERVLCDLTPFGVITAWYVHAPDLAYKVSANGSLVCYHADAMANIIATTDDQKSVIEQYAYTPYGRSLGETNLNSIRVAAIANNPYRFVGSQGVMEDAPNVYFMRARYYSAEAAVFLSTDPLKKVGPLWTPQLYLYADGNPLSNVDPLGLAAECSMPFTDREYEFYLLEGYKGRAAKGACREHDRYIEGDNPQGKTYTGYEALIFAPTENDGTFPNRATVKFLQTAIPNVHDTLSNPATKAPSLIHDGGTLGKYAGELMKDKLPGPLKAVGSVVQKAGETVAKAGDVLGSVLERVPGLSKTSNIASKTPQAVNYAGAQNAVQSVAPQMVSAVSSIGANIVGDIAGNAVAKLLPPSTPPAVKEVVKTGASAVVAAVAKPVIQSVVSSVVKVAVAVIGVPKGVVFVLVFSVFVVGCRYRSVPRYWLCRLIIRPRDFQCRRI